MRGKESLFHAAAGGKILNIAHRGARSLAPENTLAAARKALDAGADMWELDVGMSADGQLVVIHDTTLVRTSNARSVYPDRRPWLVRDFSLEELLRLDFGGWFIEQDPFGQIAAGKISADSVNSYRGEKLPTLREALELTLANDWLVNVEIKDLHGEAGDQVIVEQVVDLVKDVGVADRVILSSFNKAYLRRSRLADSRIVTGWLVSSRQLDPGESLVKLGAQYYHPRIGALELTDIPLLQARGFHVLVWGENDIEAMKALIQAGAKGIFTDFPQDLARLLREGWSREPE